MRKCLFALTALTLLTGCARPGALIGGVVAGALLLVSANKDDNGEDDGSPGGSSCRIIITQNPGGSGLGNSTRVCD
jgi:hypothetical protein